MNEEFKQLYPTNVMTGSFADYQQLPDIMNELLIKSPLLGASNKPIDMDNLFDNIDALPELASFRDQVITPAFEKYLKHYHNLSLQDFRSYKFRSWISSNDVSYHNHTSSHFSAVFYVYVDDANSGGRLELYDPRGNASRGYPALDKLTKQFARTDFQPETGKFIIFPSFLYHQVGDYLGNLRISLPVDLFLHT
jgi:hypothetical protein